MDDEWVDFTDKDNDRSERKSEEWTKGRERIVHNFIKDNPVVHRQCACQLSFGFTFSSSDVRFFYSAYIAPVNIAYSHVDRHSEIEGTWD